MKLVYKIIKLIIVLALIGGAIFYFKKDLKLAFNNFNRLVSPCGQPIDYSLGSFDKKFAISQDDFLKAANEAAQIWQKPVNKKLFSQTADGALKINLIYDSRQEATDKLRSMGLTIHRDQASFEALKSKYEALVKIYNQQKRELEDMIKYYEEKKADYEDEVKAANRRGGVTSAEYAILEQERQALNDLVAKIKQKQEALNKTVDNINAIASVVNKLIRELNLQVNNYNAIGAETAAEFQEGLYISDLSGQRINIYQFDDQPALVRVLAHELGHALGLEHLDNPQAIMYRLNESGNQAITADDLAELKRVCKIK